MCKKLNINSINIKTSRRKKKYMVQGMREAAEGEKKLLIHV